MFDGDPSVLYVSLHRHDGGSFYPGTGAAEEVRGPGCSSSSSSSSWGSCRETSGLESLLLLPPHPHPHPSAQVGSGAGAGYTLNVPWEREGMGDAEYLLAFEALIMPVARCFDPQLVLVSAGELPVGG